MVFIGLAVIIFILASLYLYFRSKYASIAYVTLAFFGTQSLLGGGHVDKMKVIFSSKTSMVIRLLENLLAALPFLIFLAYKAEWMANPILLIGQCILAFTPHRKSSNLRIPTPFKKRPFEFIVGFRSTILVIALAYFLMAKGIQVGNPNLGFAAVGLLFLLSISFQMRIEDTYFVWIYKNPPSRFLKLKITAAYKNSLILALPGALIMVAFFPELWYVGLAIIGYGLTLLLVFVLAKYAAYPKELSLPQIIILATSIFFPPLLIYTLPAFYKKAKEQLRPLLLC